MGLSSFLSVDLEKPLSQVTFSVYRNSGVREPHEGSLPAGSHLVARAELYLNREIVLDWHGVADGRQIYAAVLLDLCEVLEEVRHTTRDVLEGVRKFHPHVLAKGSTVDGNIDCGMAKALGFSEVRRVNTYLKSDGRASFEASKSFRALFPSRF